jgi:hypothetical protein
MKQTLTLIAILLLTIATGTPTAHAQSFAFERDGVELPNNIEYTVSQIDRTGTIESQLELKNKTNFSIAITASQTVLQAPTGTNAFLGICYDVCQYTNENASESGTLGTGSNNFHAFFIPETNHDDRAIVRYEIVNTANPTDKIAATITYRYGNGTAITSLPSTEILRITQTNRQIHLHTQAPTARSLRLYLYTPTGQLLSTQSLPSQDRTTLAAPPAKGRDLLRLADGPETLTSRTLNIHSRPPPVIYLKLKHRHFLSGH